MKKRILGVVGIVLILIVGISGTALAQDEISINLVGSGPGPTEFTYEVVYDDLNTGATWGPFISYDVRIATDGAMNVPACSTTFNPFGTGAGTVQSYVPTAPGVTAVYLSQMNMGGGSVTGRTVIMNVVVDSPVTGIWFNYGHSSFGWMDPAFGAHTGIAMESGADVPGLNPADTGADGHGDPVPPIPEIITIVLISIGVIALGGYVWYRRRRQQAALAA